VKDKLFIALTPVAARQAQPEVLLPEHGAATAARTP